MSKLNFNPRSIKIIIGLGNPDNKYLETYHNIGATFVTRIAQKEKNNAFILQKKGGFKHLKLKKQEWVLPLTYMNESGRAVLSVLKWFHSTPKTLLVIHDDSDLPVGTVRLEFARGAAGHNGVLSIINTLGTQAFWRARIGIRSETKEHQRIKAEVFVLKKISPAAYIEIEKAFQELDQLLDQGESK